jgi:hypothetical protein
MKNEKPAGVRSTERVFRLTGLAVSQLSAMPFDFKNFHNIEPPASAIALSNAREFFVVEIANKTASMLARWQGQLTRLYTFAEQLQETLNARFPVWCLRRRMFFGHGVDSFRR